MPFFSIPAPIMGTFLEILSSLGGTKWPFLFKITQFCPLWICYMEYTCDSRIAIQSDYECSYVTIKVDFLFLNHCGANKGYQIIHPFISLAYQITSIWKGVVKNVRKNYLRDGNCSVYAQLGVSYSFLQILHLWFGCFFCDFAWTAFVL